MTGAAWQTDAIEYLSALLEAEQAIIALMLVGSTVTASLDDYSDVDLICVVKDQSITQFYPKIDWLHPLGEIFAIEQSQQTNTFVTRACLIDFHCLDVVFILESAFRQDYRWQYPPTETRILFSRSPVVDAAIASFSPSQPTFSALNAEQFERMANQFWFKAVKAVQKVMRNDLLIGLHLTLDLARDCLVLGMIFRDRDSGTNVHRHGGLYNEFVGRIGMEAITPTVSGILTMIAQFTQAYDQLASRWSPTYQQRFETFHTWLSQMQTEIR